MQKLKLYTVYFLFLSLFFAVTLFAVNTFLAEKFNNKNVFPVEAIKIYADYLGEIHHMRGFEDYLHVKENPTKLLFSSYPEENLDKPLVLFQGDSWFDMVESAPEWGRMLTDFAGKHGLRIANGGTSSFAPTLMEKQFEILTRDFQLKPAWVVAYVDQTDIGDEYCRYRPNFYHNSDSDWGVAPEPLGADEVYEMNFFLEQQKVLNDSSSMPLTKAISFAALRIARYAPWNRKPVRCGFEDIIRPLEESDGDAVRHFEKRLISYINRVLNQGGVEKLIFVTHNHRRHLIDDDFGPKYKLSVDQVIEGVLNKLPLGSRHQISHQHIKSSSVDDFAVGDPASHLNNTSYPLFLNTVLTIVESML